MADPNTTIIHPFNAGYDARFSGNAERNGNPHKKDTIDFNAWDHGWVTADEETEDAE